MPPRSPETFCSHCSTYAPQLLKISALVASIGVLGVATGPTGLGAYQQFSDLFLSEAAGIALGIVAASTVFGQFLQSLLQLKDNFSHRNPEEINSMDVATLPDFKKNMGLILLLSIAYSAASGLFAREQFSGLALAIFMGSTNGLGNVPFAIENTILVIKMLKHFPKVWADYTCCQKIGLILTLLFVLFCVFCVLLIYAGPAVRLAMKIPIPFFNTLVAILFAILSTSIEAFFQATSMLCLEDTQNSRQLVGFFKNPFPADACEHKFRVFISTILAGVLAGSNKYYTQKEVSGYDIPHAEELAQIASWFAAFMVEYSGIEPTDRVITQPFFNGVSHLSASIYAKMPENIKRIIKRLFACCPHGSSQSGYTII